MVSVLPPELRIMATPDPPVIQGAPVAYVFYREVDSEQKVLIYFVFFLFKN